METLNSRLKYARAKKTCRGIDDIAHCVGCTVADLIKYETDVVPVPRRIVVSLGIQYDVHERWLFTGEGEMAKKYMCLPEFPSRLKRLPKKENK